MSPDAVLAVERVTEQGWRSAVEQQLAGGALFESLYAVGSGDDASVRLLLRGPAGRRLLSVLAASRELASIVDLVPAAQWDEREAHDLHGILFAGHEPLRALVAHPDDPEAWVTPVDGPDVFELAVGPIHAGIIESGHFRFHVVGERIVHLDARLFYKHRGLERAAQGRAVADGLAVVRRACGACAVANAVAYAHAAERALGLAADDDLRRSRTLLLELERLYNHLGDLSALCAGVGFDPGTMAFAALKERAQRVNARVGGHRFLFGTVSVGTGPVTVPENLAPELRGELAAIAREAAATWRTLSFMASIHDRFSGVGVLTLEDAERFGAVGPVARASGVHRDARVEEPELLWYPGLRAARPQTPTGDVAARAELRAVELEQTCALLDELLQHGLPAGTTVQILEPSGVGAARVESPRGATVCVLETAHGLVERVHLRTGSYANWPVLARVVPGNIVPDFPLINKSFELCYACADR